jgi:hypothetical protein
MPVTLVPLHSAITCDSNEDTDIVFLQEISNLAMELTLPGGQKHITKLFSKSWDSSEGSEI